MDKPAASQEALTGIEVISIAKRYLSGVSHPTMYGDTQVKFVLYDAFVIRGSLDDYGSGKCWGFSLVLDSETAIGELLGQRLSLCEGKEAIERALSTIDRYARLRLGEEYLAAYEESQK